MWVSVTIATVSSHIDERFFYVWSGANFPFINLLSIASVLTHHPKAHICVVVDAFPSSSHFEELRNRPNVEIQLVNPDVLFSQLPIKFQHVKSIFYSLPENATTARSNIIRYVLLYLYGGVYLDFDVLLLKPLTALLPNKSFIGEEFVWVDNCARLRGSRSIFLYPRNILWAVTQLVLRLDAFVFRGALHMGYFLRRSFRLWSRPQLNNAVIGSVAESEFLSLVLWHLRDSDPKIRYSTGPTLVQKVAELKNHEATVLPSETFYCVAPGQSFRMFKDERLKLHPDAVGLHYVASNHLREIDELTSGRISSLTDTSIMSLVLRDVYSQYLLHFEKETFGYVGTTG